MFWPKPITLAALAAILAVAAGEWAGSVAEDRAAEAQAFRVVYYAADAARRDPDAAMRKARYKTDLLARDFGVSRGDAAVEVARFMILGNGICEGVLAPSVTR